MPIEYIGFAPQPRVECRDLFNFSDYFDRWFGFQFIHMSITVNTTEGHLL